MGGRQKSDGTDLCKPHGKDRKQTFRELRDLSNRLANGLKAHGITRKDRIGILLSQRPETLISHISVYKLGAIAVQLLTLFGPDALELRLQDSAAKALITDKDNLSKIREIKERLPDFMPVKTKPDDPALIIYTSGTTTISG